MSDAQQRPNVVEDISSHEFYANLIGKKPLAVKSNSSTFTTTDKNRRRFTPSLPVVASDESAAPTSTDEFSKTYQRALSDPPKYSSLSLDQSNKGFKLLSQMGWNEQDGGLGKRRQGNLTPIKTRIKNDKRGLGRGKKQPERVTHHPHQRAQEVEAKETKAQRKRRRKAEREQDQHCQKRARMLLRTDISDEYEQLYMSLHGG